MFSKNKAPAGLIVMPVLLLIIAIFLGFQLVTKLSPANQTSTDQNTTIEETPKVDQQSSRSDSNQIIEPQSANDRYNDALQASPSRENYPSNKCPDATVSESDSRFFALEGSSKFILTSIDKTWIDLNCPNTESLNF